MMKLLSALLAGLVFGIGLIYSGMSDPFKVQGFLDLAGHWNPSLALVMGGALLVGMVAFPLAARRKQSLLGEPMRMPAAAPIDRRLLLGALGFGVGWGLAGFCPGPAIASLLLGGKALVFCLAMLAGMALFELIESVRTG